MNTAILNRIGTDPLLNLRNCQGLNVLYGDRPEGNLRAALPEILTTDENVGFRPLDNVCPPMAWASGNGEMIIWVAGTSGRIHLQQLLDGWSSVYDDWQTSYGASGAFYNAAVLIKDFIGPAEITACNKFYLIGHSYGGAVCQALAAILQTALQAKIKVWSYGSPRPGLFRLGTILRSIQNTRIFADNDPVRFIPPHSSEVPSLTYLDEWPLVRGCNTQVQCPDGWELADNGTLLETEGNPTVLHAVALSIANWCMDLNGFRSVNHGLQNYIGRFQLAYGALNPPVVISPNRPREQPEVITIRQRDNIAAVGRMDVDNTIAVAPNINTAYVVPQIPPLSTLRYVRRRVGRVWGVKYDGQVVAIGPGKRQARKLAKQFNRAAQANW